MKLSLNSSFFLLVNPLFFGKFWGKTLSMLWVKITILFLNSELGDTVKIPIVAGVKTHFWG
jgi:hypothetical protein